MPREFTACRKVVLGCLVAVVLVVIAVVVATQVGGSESHDAIGKCPNGRDPNPMHKNSFSAGEHFEHCGDVIVEGNVPMDNQVTVTEGDLTIKGNVLPQAKIAIARIPNKPSKRSLTLRVNGYVNGASLKTTSADIVVNEYVSNKAMITSTSGNIQCLKSTDSTLNTESGNIKVLKQIKLSTIETSSGNVEGKDIIKSTVNTVSGDILAHDQIEDSKIETTSGEVQATVITQKTKIETTSGDVKCKDITRSTVTTLSGDVIASGTISHSTVKTTSGDVTFGSQVDSDIDSK